MSIGTVTDQPLVLAVDGVPRKFFALTFADFGELQSWVDSRWINPLDVIRDQLASFGVDQQKFMIREAIALASKPKPQIGSEEADVILRSLDGIREFIYQSLKRGDPAMTRDSAREIHSKLSNSDVAAIFSIGFGFPISPADDAAGGDSPKG